MKPSHLPFFATALGLGTLAGCAHEVASLDGPAHLARPATPSTITVELHQNADPQSFQASVDGQDITSHFALEDGHAQLDGYIFEPVPGQQPHHLTVSTQPKLDRKGRPMGQTFSKTLTFFPPQPVLQGNVGIGVNSHVDVPESGRASVMLRLPQAVHRPTTFTIRPVPMPEAQRLGLAPNQMLDCVAVNDDSAGEITFITVAAGQRVAVFEIDGQRPGFTALRVEAPGYVASSIKVFVQPDPGNRTAALP